jgi:hypothetical protein
MRTLRERMENPFALRPLSETGIGPATLAARLGLRQDPMGCYLFIDEGRPVYVGISKHLCARILEHVRGTDHFTATLAYQIATGRHPHHTTASQAIKDPDFRARFIEARESLRDMSVAFVEIANPLELYVFEAYCALELETGVDNGGWNTFATH